MQINQYIDSEQQAAQKFDPGTIRLLSNTTKENRMGNPVSYQIIPYAGGTTRWQPAPNSRRMSGFTTV
jgi:primary-amine oxidase